MRREAKPGISMGTAGVVKKQGGTINKGDITQAFKLGYFEVVYCAFVVNKSFQCLDIFSKSNVMHEYIKNILIACDGTTTYHANKGVMKNHIYNYFELIQRR